MSKMPKIMKIIQQYDYVSVPTEQPKTDEISFAVNDNHSHAHNVFYLRESSRRGFEISDDFFFCNYLRYVNPIDHIPSFVLKHDELMDIIAKYDLLKIKSIYNDLYAFSVSSNMFQLDELKEVLKQLYDCMQEIFALLPER